MQIMCRSLSRVLIALLSVAILLAWASAPVRAAEPVPPAKPTVPKPGREPVKTCPPGQTVTKDMKCAVIPVCGPNQVLLLNRCFDKCPDGSDPRNDGKCSKVH